MFKNGRPVIYALITFLATVTCTTISHYAEIWVAGYFVGALFAAFSALLLSIVDTGDE